MIVNFFNPIAIGKVQVDASIFNQLNQISLALFTKSSTEEDYPGDNYLTLRGGEQRRVWPSKNNFDWVKQWIENAAREYQESVFNQSNQWGDLNLKPRLANCWTITQPQHSYQVTHTHPYGAISGCLYLETPVFDQASDNTDGCISFMFDKMSNPDAVQFVHVKPIVGTMLIFPSWLAHQVYPWSGTGQRRVLAWDCHLA